MGLQTRKTHLCRRFKHFLNQTDHRRGGKYPERRYVVGYLPRRQPHMGRENDLFKRGAFMLAAEFRLPVVPITIDGSFKAMPRNTYCITPTTITLTIHKPIYPGERGFNTKKLMAECREAINSALPDEDKDITDI